MTSRFRALAAIVILASITGSPVARAAIGTDPNSLRFRALFGLTQDLKILDADVFTTTSVEEYGVSPYGQRGAGH